MKCIKLGDICNIKTGKLDANASSKDGKYPFFTCSKEPLLINEYSYDCECVLVAGNGDLNVKYYNGKFDAYQRTYIIEVNDKTKFNTKYIYLLLSSKIEELRKKSIGGVIKYIKLGDLTTINVPSITMIEQKKIIDKFFKIRDIINLKKHQILKFDRIVKFQFVKMFGNLKNNDKNWKNVDKLGNVTILNPTKNEINNIDKNLMVTFLPMQNVSTEGVLDCSIEKKIKDVWKGFTYFKDNDILFAKITPCMENGKGAVARNLKNNIGFGTTEFHVIRPKESINSIWLFTFFSNDKFRIEAKKNMTGSAGQKRVPISFFENYKIAIPPIELQNKFANIVEQIDKQKIIFEKSLKKLEELQAALMQEYFG